MTWRPQSLLTNEMYSVCSNYGFVGAVLSEDGIVGPKHAEYFLTAQWNLNKAFFINRLGVRINTYEVTGIEVVTGFDMDVACDSESLSRNGIATQNQAT